ncbi:photosystem I reaction center subunit IX [Calothrix sp. NIES-3974]|nr:photosystem I reaction center subunit IX [Calothrix sp. NIES-3974]BAZ04413.1 photosystem I reaction center subunit IX [Calothrix sp. NIES-3974]
MEVRYFLKYISTVPVVATVLVIAISVVMIVLNYIFPGLQYGTFFHPLPS